MKNRSNNYSMSALDMYRKHPKLLRNELSSIPEAINYSGSNNNIKSAIYQFPGNILILYRI